jgi:hypothetical protein
VTQYAFVNDSGVTELRGTLVPDPAGLTGSFLTGEVALTNADIIALGNQVAKTVVAAPAAGSYLNFVHGIVTVDATAVAYGNIDAQGTLGFGFTSNAASGVLDASGIGGLLGGDGEVAVATFPPFTTGAALVNYGDASQVEALPLVLRCWNDNAGPYNGGDAANSGRAKVWYTVETLP